jgi:hypothetical protein
MTEAERLLQLLDEKRVEKGKQDLVCPICGHGEFRWGSEIAVIFASQPRDSVGLPTRGHEALQITCAHCGFMSLHRATVLRGEVSNLEAPLS